jgi:hypothetical protein
MKGNAKGPLRLPVPGACPLYCHGSEGAPAARCPDARVTALLGMQTFAVATVTAEPAPSSRNGTR